MITITLTLHEMDQEIPPEDDSKMFLLLMCDFPNGKVVYWNKTHSVFVGAHDDIVEPRGYDLWAEIEVPENGL